MTRRKDFCSTDIKIRRKSAGSSSLNKRLLRHRYLEYLVEELFYMINILNRIIYNRQSQIVCQVRMILSNKHFIDITIDIKPGDLLTVV